ncbi:hypothetical protein ACJX0J_012320, partial [Zea mays]
GLYTFILVAMLASDFDRVKPMLASDFDRPMLTGDFGDLDYYSSFTYIIFWIYAIHIIHGTETSKWNVRRAVQIRLVKSAVEIIMFLYHMLMIAGQKFDSVLKTFGVFMVLDKHESLDDVGEISNIIEIDN